MVFFSDLVGLKVVIFHGFNEWDSSRDSLESHHRWPPGDFLWFSPRGRRIHWEAEERSLFVQTHPNAPRPWPSWASWPLLLVVEGAPQPYHGMMPLEQIFSGWGDLCQICFFWGYFRSDSGIVPSVPGSVWPQKKWSKWRDSISWVPKEIPNTAVIGDKKLVWEWNQTTD